MISGRSLFELFSLILVAGVLIGLLVRRFSKPKKHEVTRIVDQMTGATVYVFNRINIFRTFLFIFIGSIWCIYFIYTKNSLIPLIFIFILAISPFLEISQLRFDQQKLVIKSLFKTVAHIKYTEIKLFSEGWKNPSIMIFILKKRFIPLLFISRGEIPEHVDEILKKLEERTHKKRGVIF
jgi:hypothetical protein